MELKLRQDRYPWSEYFKRNLRKGSLAGWQRTAPGPYSRRPLKNDLSAPNQSRHGPPAHNSTGLLLPRFSDSRKGSAASLPQQPGYYFLNSSGELQPVDGALDKIISSTAKAPDVLDSYDQILKSPTFPVHTKENDLRPSRRRVDFHWLVRERNSLRWLSSLLNRVHGLTADLDRNELELNITTHITAKRKNISEHVFRYLLDSFRTPSQPRFALTELKAKSSFGRPDLVQILNDYYRDEVNRMKVDKSYGDATQVGVFFCGDPRIGRVLADACFDLTAMGRMDGSRVKFVFMMEVFM